MPETVLIGTGNAHKAVELVEILRDLSWTVKTLKDFPDVEAPEETGDSFETNVLIKALYYTRRCKLSCIADDSGLEVDALDGAPGVYSARFAGVNCTYEENNVKLLGALRNVPLEKRTARFVCFAAFADLDGSVHIVRGTVEGTIAVEVRGENGFGYDPLFIPEKLNTTFAEMTSEEKHAMSHRGRAFKRLRNYLEYVRANRTV